MAALATAAAATAAADAAAREAQALAGPPSAQPASVARQVIRMFSPFDNPYLTWLNVSLCCVISSVSGHRFEL